MIKGSRAWDHRLQLTLRGKACDGKIAQPKITSSGEQRARGTVSFPILMLLSERVGLA